MNEGSIADQVYEVVAHDGEEGFFRIYTQS